MVCSCCQQWEISFLLSSLKSTWRTIQRHIWKFWMKFSYSGLRGASTLHLPMCQKHYRPSWRDVPRFVSLNVWPSSSPDLIPYWTMLRKFLTLDSIPMYVISLKILKGQYYSQSSAVNAYHVWRAHIQQIVDAKDEHIRVKRL